MATTVSKNSDEGVYAVDSTQVTISASTISQNGDDGVDVEDTARANIDASRIVENRDRGIEASGRSEVIVQSSTLTRNAWASIALLDYVKATIRNNVIEETKHSPKGNFGRGIYLRSSAQATIEGNIISNNEDDGISLGRSSRATILKNTIEGNDHGILIGYDNVSGETAQAEISENTIQNNRRCGVRVNRDPNIRVTGSGNRISGNNPDLCDPAGKLPAGFTRP